MKKRLVILPLLALASITLASCGGDDPKKPVDPEIDTSKLGPEEVYGHKRATKLEDGASYYMGVCKRNENDRLMFINGEPHSDAKGVYPFYMSETEITSEEELETEAAKVTVEYVEGSTTEFNLKIEKEDATNDGKYIGIYKATSSYSKAVLSIHCADFVGQLHEDTDPCDYNFTWLEEYEEYAVQTAVIMIKDDREGVEDTEPTPKFFGTGGEFVSVDCTRAEKAFEEEYNLAYFYEA